MAHRLAITVIAASVVAILHSSSPAVKCATHVVLLDYTDGPVLSVCNLHGTAAPHTCTAHLHYGMPTSSTTGSEFRAAQRSSCCGLISSSSRPAPRFWLVLRLGNCTISPAF